MNFRPYISLLTEITSNTASISAGHASAVHQTARAVTPQSAQNAPPRTQERTPQERAHLAAVTEYYRVTDADYAAWSHGFNMHFGLCGLADNPFDREAMVERMNQRVLARVGVMPRGRYADLGCGTGATARALAWCEPTAAITGITISPEQVARGRAMNAQAGQSQIDMRRADYLETGLSPASQDGAYAIESACHAPGAGKARLIAEAARVLKPGARFVIADAMLRGTPPTGLLGSIYRAWCRSWAIPQLTELPALAAELTANGFCDIRVEDVSRNVAASAAHIPWVATRFTLQQLWQNGGRLPPWRWRHIAASYLSLVLGVSMHKFGYFIVTARRTAAATGTR